MMDFLTQYHLSGLLIGAASFGLIGLFHPLVVKTHYYCGTGAWWVFLILGLGGVGLSVYTGHILVSALAGVFGFTSLWTIGELFEQEKRVAKGWFPGNPKRKKERS